MAAVTRRDFYAVAAVYAPDAVWDVSRLGLEGSSKAEMRYAVSMKA
jgi:ketosteroid isomerase-like protein